MKNVLNPQREGVLTRLGLTAAVSVTEEAIRKNIFGSRLTALII